MSLTQEDVFLIGMYQENNEQIPDDLLNRLTSFCKELNKKLVFPIQEVKIDLNAPLSMQVEIRAYKDGFTEVHHISIEDFLAGNVCISTNANQQVFLAYTLIPAFGIILSWIGFENRLHNWLIALAASVLYVGGLVYGLDDVQHKKFEKFKFGANLILLIGGAILTLVLFIFKGNGFEVN